MFANADPITSASDGALRLLAESLPQIVWMCDARGRVTFVNRAYRDFFGIGGSRSSGGRTPEIHPDDRERAAAAWSRCLRDHQAAAAELRVRHASGEWRSLSVAVHPVREGGSVVAFAGSGTDVTEQRAERRSLRRDVAQFRGYFENAAVGMSQVDLETGRLLLVNPGMCDITGYSADELRTMSFRDITHPEDRGANWADFREAMARDATYRVEKRYIRKDGVVIWVRVTASVIRDSEGRSAHCAAVIEDITDRRRAQDSLRDSVELFRSLAEGMPHTVWICDAGGNNLYQNTVWYEYTGTVPGSGHGREWFWLYHPDDRDFLMREWTETLQTGGEHALDVEARIRRHDGEYRWFRVMASPIRDAAGKVVRWVGICTDIHEQRRLIEALRRSEEQYRTLFESIDEGFCVIEMLFEGGGRPVDYRFLQINPAFERQSGLRGAVGRRMRELVPGHEPQWFEAFGRVAVTGEPVRFVKEARAMGRWFDVYALRTRRDAPIVAVLFNDVTQRICAEEALRRSNRELHRFTAIASHDLKEPLRGVGSIAEFMLEEEPALTDEGRTRLRRISDLCQRLILMIGGLLEYARAGGEHRDQPCDLGVIAHRAVDKLAESIGREGAEVSVAEGLPTVRGDPVLLERALANLVVNGLKYNSSPVKRVEIGASGGAVFVRDNGIGIDPRHHARVFDLFSRIPSARSQEGIGMGLALTKNIIESHGGKIWVTSQPGAGATFFIRLPAATRHDDAPLVHAGGPTAARPA